MLKFFQESNRIPIYKLDKCSFICELLSGKHTHSQLKKHLFPVLYIFEDGKEKTTIPD
jgi:hypothetical protein